jgi:hypothetical protein
MADYLNARPRNRSESINTDASSTVASPLPTPIPNSKLTPLIGTKFPTNTILKSHGRPPWYYLDYVPKYRQDLDYVVL